MDSRHLIGAPTLEISHTEQHLLATMNPPYGGTVVTPYKATTYSSLAQKLKNPNQSYVYVIGMEYAFQVLWSKSDYLTTTRQKSSNTEFTFLACNRSILMDIATTMVDFLGPAIDFACNRQSLKEQ